MNTYKFYQKSTWAGSLMEKATIKASTLAQAKAKFKKKHPRLKRVYAINTTHLKIIS